MNTHIQKFRKSFQLKNTFWYTLLVDVGFFAVMWFLVFYFGNLVKQKAMTLSGGKSAEEIQQMLLNMQADQSAAFVSNVQGFVTSFFLAIIVVVIGGLLLFSLSRNLIWNKLTNKKFNKKLFWKWNLLVLVLVIPLIVYFFLTGILNIVLINIASLFNHQGFVDIFSMFLSLLFFLVLVTLTFLIFNSFIEKQKIWESIGNAFNIVKEKWERIWPMFLLILLTVVMLSLLLWLVSSAFKSSQSFLTVINFALTLLLLNWMRIYIFRIVKNEA